MKKVMICIYLLIFSCFFYDVCQAQEQNVEEQELLNKIEELEKRVNELTEESRARRKLEITEKEKEEKEKEVLEAVSRDYTLDPKHTLSLDYSFNYAYSPSETITSELYIEREADHTLRHTIATSYSVLDNMSVSSSLPFVYRYNQRGTSDEITETDIGDITVGLAFQPFKSETGQVRKTFNFSATLPTGRSPFKINPETELTTGNGLYAFSLSGSFSKQIDPVVVFWSLGYTYKLDATGLDYYVADGYTLDKVEPGNAVSLSAGLAYALSYKVSLNTVFSYQYSYTNTYFYQGISQGIKPGDETAASIAFGMGWKATQKTTLSFSVGYSLADTGFSFTFRAPFTFIL